MRLYKKGEIPVAFMQAIGVHAIDFWEKKEDSWLSSKSELSDGFYAIHYASFESKERIRELMEGGYWMAEQSSNDFNVAEVKNGEIIKIHREL